MTIFDRCCAADRRVGIHSALPHFMTVPASRARPARFRLTSRCILAGIIALAASAPMAHAQRRSRPRFPNELHGSQESVQKMWDFATMHGLTFYQTPRDIDRAVSEG